MDKKQIYVELQDYSCESRDLALLSALQTYLCTKIIKYLPYLFTATNIDMWICQILMICFGFLFNHRVVTRCRTAIKCLTKMLITGHEKNGIIKFCVKSVWIQI